MPEGEWHAVRRELTAAADAELAAWWARYHRTLATSNHEFAKYRRSQVSANFPMALQATAGP